MRRSELVRAAFLAMAVAAVLWLPSSASARPRWVGPTYGSSWYGSPYYYQSQPYYYSGYYSGGPYYWYGGRPRYYAAPYYSTYTNVTPSAVTYEPSTVTYSTSSYRASAPADDRAFVTIQIPGDAADIWIQGEQSRQTKSRQDYISPPLTPGKTYYYEVRARWRDGDQMHEAKRNFEIVPGTPVLVDFTRVASVNP